MKEWLDDFNQIYIIFHMELNSKSLNRQSSEEELGKSEL